MIFLYYLIHHPDIRVWDVLAELVKLCTLPSPHNPFAVDLEYFSSLPLTERVVAEAAMAHFLQMVLLYAGDKSYSGLGKEGLIQPLYPHLF